MTIDFNRTNSFHFVNGDWAVNDGGDFACVLAVSETLGRDTESWECYRYTFLNDSGLWANGRVLEVEPDVAMYAYIDSFMHPLRTQRLRVMRDGRFEPTG